MRTSSAWGMSAVSLVAALYACSAPNEKPPPSSSGFSSGGSTGTSGASGGDGGSSGGDGGSSGTSGTSGTSGASGAPGGPFPIGCDQLDPTRVYLHGTLRSATVGYEVTYDLTSKAWCGLIGQDVKPPSRPTIRKDGKLLYVEDGKVYAMTRDINLVYDDAYKHWTYDSTGIRARANDTELPTTCAALQLTSVFAWPDVNDFAVKCGTNVMTPMGAVLAATGAVHALGYTGHILAEDPTGLRELRVFDNVGGSLKVTAIGNTIGVHAVRAKADGFLVALTTGIGTPLDLWDVKFNASATKVGTYAAVPAGHTDTGGDVMDATGNLYATSVGPGGADFALKRPLQPAASSVVFDETNEEVKIHGDDFVTGP